MPPMKLLIPVDIRLRYQHRRKVPGPWPCSSQWPRLQREPEARRKGTKPAVKSHPLLFLGALEENCCIRDAFIDMPGVERFRESHQFKDTFQPTYETELFRDFLTGAFGSLL